MRTKKTPATWIYCGDLLALVVFSLGFARDSLAHGFHAHHGDGFSAGFLHPIFGLDHLLAALAVGIIASLRNGQRLFVLPIIFSAFVAFGAAAGVLGVFSGAEPMIAASVILLGLLLAGDLQFLGRVEVPLLAVFGFLHGIQHGQEITGASALAVIGGLFLATLLLHLVGVLVSRALRMKEFVLRARRVGALLAIVGMGFFIQSF